jgi:ABC-type phosphate/phosphonate transport system substrate-binding protein
MGFHRGIDDPGISTIFPNMDAGRMKAVQSGEFDAGALDYSIYEDEKKAGRVDENNVPIIWETPPYPDNHFTIRGDLDEVYTGRCGYKRVQVSFGRR